MAHNLERQENGLYSYVGRQAAWHGLGMVTDHLMSYEEIKQHCLNWQCYTAPLFSANGIKTKFYGVFRNDNEECLGVCSAKYNPIPHSLGFEMVSYLLGREDCFETAGVLGKGEKVWGLGALPESRLGDDKTENYLLFVKSYDLTMPNVFKLVRTRVVCQNTLTASLKELTSMITVRNTKNGEMFLRDRIKALQHVQTAIQQMDKNNYMLANTLSTPQIDHQVMLDLFPLTAKKDERGEKVMVSPTRRTNIVNRVMSCVEDNDDNAFPEQRGTLYNLLNGITEYVDHYRSKKDSDEEGEGESAAVSAMFGTGDTLKNKAYSILVDIAKNAPSRPTTVYSVPSVPTLSAPSLSYTSPLLLEYSPEAEA